MAANAPIGQSATAAKERRPAWRERTVWARICVCLWQVALSACAIGTTFLIIGGQFRWAFVWFMAVFAVMWIIGLASGEFPWFPDGVPDGYVRSQRRRCRREI